MNNIELLIDRVAKTAGTEIMRTRDTKEHEKHGKPHLMAPRGNCTQGHRETGEALDHYQGS
jgi:hypothetical protein